MDFSDDRASFLLARSSFIRMGGTREKNGIGGSHKLKADPNWICLTIMKKGAFLIYCILGTKGGKSRGLRKPGRACTT